MATMELKLDRATFQDALYKAQGVVDKKSTVNVLSHVLLESQGDGRVRLSGTDYDVMLQAEVPAEVLEAGTACINGKSLFDVVKSVGERAVHLQVLPNHWVELTAGRSRFKLAGIAAGDFPEMALPDDIAWVSMPRASLKDLIEKTAFSVSDDETRMNLNGVFFQVSQLDDGQARLAMVSTDGHRLSKMELTGLELGGYDGQPHDAIVHKKGVQELRRLLDDDVDNVKVGFAKGVILFRAEVSDDDRPRTSTTFTVRQIEDSYPDYQRVIPDASPIKLKVSRQAMVSAVRRIAILTSSKTYIIKMELEPGRLAFTTSNPDYGEGRDELDVEYDGDGMVIGFNYTYLLEVLGVLHGDDVELEISDEYGPCLISSPSEPGGLFVVMPMRI